MKKIEMLLLLVIAMAPVANAQKFQQEFGNPRKAFVEAVAVPNHSDSHYQIGQTAKLRITAREGGMPLDGTVLRYKVGPEMWLSERWDSTHFVDGEAIISMGTMNVPGFLACQYEFTTSDGKTTKDLVKLAYEPDQIKTLTPMPQDFKKYWANLLKEARKVPFQPEYREVPDATNDQFITSLVRLRVGKDKWMQGYLTIPRGSGPYPVVLCPPGAGSQKIYPSDYFPKQNCIYMKIEIHDNDQMLADDAYNEMRKRCEGYMYRGMASRDTYYYKDVYVGCARALDFLCSLPEWDGKNAIVTGGSQGGALTIITAAINEKATLCAPFYPALCDLTGFIHHRAGGWPKFFNGSSNDANIGVSQEQAVATLQYYDVVNFARILNIPTFMSWGYSDDTCSPTSVWAAWNEIKAPKAKDITPSSGHWRFPASWEKCWNWLKARMAEVDSEVKDDEDHSFKPGELWHDNRGEHINAHGGGVLLHNGKFYWYGEHKSSHGNAAYKGVTCYSSTNLTDWTYEGIALPVTDSVGADLERGCIIERPKVLFNKKSGKFVMWFHLELKGQGYNAARYGVAISDSPSGPFRYLYSQRANAGKYPVEFGRKEMAVLDTLQLDKYDQWWTPSWREAITKGLFVKRDVSGGQMSRDMTLFVDDDGHAYHIFSSEDNLTLHIAELTDDYTKHTGRYTRVAPGGHNEAPAIFKRQGKYWMITSGCTGWDPNEARMFSASSIWGPWIQHPNPCKGPNAEKTFGGQGTFVLTLDSNASKILKNLPAGKTPTYIFMADIWRPKHPNDARYIWLPITFENGMPVIRWQEKWSLDNL